MVVTCEECHAKFLLDESRLTGPVTKARCSRCGHVFAIEKAGEPGGGGPLEKEGEPDVPLTEPRDEADAGLPSLSGTSGPPPAPAEAEEEPEPQAPASAAIPKPTILITVPPRRSIWRRIAYISGGVIVVLAACGLALWFWGKPLLLYFKSKGPAAPPAAEAPAAKAPVAKAPAGQAPAGKAPAPQALETVAPPAGPPATAEDLKDVQIFNQEERYRGLVNAKGGQLLLIQGQVKNASNKPRGPIRIMAILTDPQHRVLKERQFYAGTFIFDDELQKLDPDEINRWLDTPGGRAQKQILEPGETQSFMVVFFDAPQNLTGYSYKMRVVKGPEAPGNTRSHD